MAFPTLARSAGCDPTPFEPAGRAVPASVRRRSPALALGGLITLVGLFVLALALRWYHVQTAYDIFIDEPTYRQLAVNLATGKGLTLYGSPFTLHPPVAFLVMAAAVRVLGLDGPPIRDIEHLRYVLAAIGSLLVPLVYLVMRRLGAGWVLSVGAAVYLALDPFQISFDSRVLMEPVAQLFATMTMLLLVVATKRSDRVGAAATVAAGVAGGLTITSKETFGLVVCLTLLLVLALERSCRRRVTTVLALTLAGYVVNAVVTSIVVGFSTWWQFRLDGILRLVGASQPTGFNSTQSQVTLSSRVFADFDLLVLTYIVLALGGVGALVALVRRLRHRDAASGAGALVVPLWTFSACVYLGYATLFGSIEEQMYYIPLLPCVLMTFLWLSTWGHGLPPVVRRSVLAGLVAVPLAYNGLFWYHVHTTDVNSYQNLLAWMPDHVSADSRIALTEDTSQFLLQTGQLGTWSTARELKKNDVDYVLVQSKLVAEGYGEARPTLLRQLRKHGHVVFTANSADDGQLLLFDVRSWTGGSS